MIEGSLSSLNTRELDIIGLISKGLSNNEIAGKLNLSPETVKWYNKIIFSKLGVSSRTEAAAMVKEDGLIDAQPISDRSKNQRTSNNLPAPVNSFVGRTDEIEDIENLLNAARLIVLTGPGGSGKTRLALQVARKRAGFYRDGVWLVELAPLVDPQQIVNTISEVFRLTSSSEEAPIEPLKRFLARKHMLLLLDNFEHLLEAAPLVGEILSAAPLVTILSTSRERLRIYGEQEYPVHPLSLPEAARAESLKDMLQSDALNLFVQRAQASRAGFSVSDVHIEAVVQICTRLDGLPLAIELAASQVKLFTLPQLAERLKDNLSSLPAGSRDLPARQRTLRATIEWSYALLGKEEKELFARLSVFNGGATLEAIEAICAHQSGKSVVDNLTSLIDKNLVTTREGRDGELYFSMLETIHEFASECLELLGEAVSIRTRYAGYYTTLVEDVEKDIRSSRQMYWFLRFRMEWPNLQAVLSWSFHGNDVDFGLRLVDALAYFWYYDGHHLNEVTRWVDLALEKCASASPALQAGVMQTAGLVYFANGDHKIGKNFHEKALALFRSIGDETDAAWSQIYLCMFYTGSTNDIEIGLAICKDGLAYFTNTSQKYGICQAYNILGELTRKKGDYDAAEQYYKACLEVAEETGEPLRIAMQYANLGFIAYHKNQPQLAEKLSIKGLDLFNKIQNNFGVLTTIPALAGSAIMVGDYTRAAILLGSSHALLIEMGSRYQITDQYEIDNFIEETRKALGEEAFRKAWEQGAALTYAEALAYALGEE